MNKHKTSESQVATTTWHTTLLMVIGIISGLVVGAVAALLYAPKSGKKTRRNLTKNFEESLHSGQDAIDPVIKRLEQDVSELRETLEDRFAKLR